MTHPTGRLAGDRSLIGMVLIAVVVPISACSLFTTDNRYSVRGRVETCEHLDGILVRCFDEPNQYITIVLDGDGGRHSTVYSAGGFRFDDVLEGGYEVSISHPAGYLERIAADSIWAPPRWIFVPPQLLGPYEVRLDEWIYYCEKTCGAR